VTALDEALGLVPGSSHVRADTLSPDVEGLRRPLDVGAPTWPLISALAQPWGEGQPLTWLAALPATETPTLEKSALVGTTVRVAISMGTPVTLTAWTDVAIQATRSPSVLAAIQAVLAHQVACDADRYVAQQLVNASGAPVAGSAPALGAIAQWPGEKLLVLGNNAALEVGYWAGLANYSAGALSVIFDPQLAVGLAIAKAGVAVGALGLTSLIEDNPAQAGIDVAELATVAVRAGAGAVASWDAVTTRAVWANATWGSDVWTP
jgi:hypothetical protein